MGMGEMNYASSSPPSIPVAFIPALKGEAFCAMCGKEAVMLKSSTQSYGAQVSN